MATGKLTILLVEDDTDILEEIAGYLRRRQYEVVTAPDFGSGRLALADEGRYPDVLVTDVHLPDGDGLDLLEHVNSRTPPPPRPRVIVMTGHLDAQKVGQAQRDGAETVLLKPFSLGTLLQQLRTGEA
ncbi:MAG: response regulator [Alphaproteobacteria bacterium]|nr:response regulator [Alphaproteobacteria bacterium]MCW5741333.1 response regulator [Alphaproteobacteria bacterium]